MLLSRIGAGMAIGTAVLLGAGTALAAPNWTIVPVPPTGQNAFLAGVSSTSDSDAWAVGSDNAELNGVGAKPLIDHWNGTAWSQLTPPATPGNTASLAAVSASGPADAWAIGRTQVNREDFAPLALHWNGTAWTVSPSAATALAGQIGIGVTDISPTDAYAIGGHLGSASSGELAHWNGTSWANVSVPLPPGNGGRATDFDAISADSPTDVWVIGTYSLEVTPSDFAQETYSLHWNGSTWSVVPMPQVPGTNPNEEFHLNSVKANSPDDVWAVGDSGIVDATTSQTLIEHWNGTAWSIVPSPSPGGLNILNGVTTSNAANDVWAVGVDTAPGTSQSQTLTLNWNGTSWVTVPSPNSGSAGSTLLSVATTPGASIVQAVGYTGTNGSYNPLSLQNG